VFFNLMPENDVSEILILLFVVDKAGVGKQSSNKCRVHRNVYNIP
jgi:hypothetical protein